MTRFYRYCLLCALLVCLGVSTFAVVTPSNDTELDHLQRAVPSPWQNRLVAPYDTVAPKMANNGPWESLRASLGENHRLYVDLRSGEPALVMGAPVPFIPGKGNNLTLEDVASFAGGPVTEITEEVVAAIGENYLAQQAGVLAVPISELHLKSSSEVNENLRVLAYEHRPNGIAVAASSVVLVIGHGNLIQWGASNVYPVTDFDGRKLSSGQALDAARGYFGWDDSRDSLEAGPELVYLPRSRGTSPLADDAPARYHQLVWEMIVRRSGVVGTWLIHVDARSGEIVQFGDINRYAVVRGGIEPLTWTDPEVSRPLPLVDLGGGNFSSLEGNHSQPAPVTGTFDGQLCRIQDQCGGAAGFPSVVSDGSGNIDFGTGPANPMGDADCTTNGIGGVHNTHASRSAYYHITRLKHKSRQWLPGAANTWLAGSHDVRVNINNTCNAYWQPAGGFNGFFQEGFNAQLGLICYNTGEIAGVFLHEVGHGMDSNDALGTSDGGTGEAYADIIAMLELHASCLGDKFWQQQCTGYGLPCTNCESVRDADYAAHVDGGGVQIANPFTPTNYTGPQCPGAFFGAGPCGKEVHCEAYPGTGAIWDLAARKLVPDFDQATAWYIVEHAFMPSTNISASMFNCNTTTFASDGCASTSWFQSMLAVDDDNGDLTDGTPHAAYFWEAFNDHDIACGNVGDPENQNNSACPSLATPVVSLAENSGSNAIDLSWGSIANAAGYAILRNHGDCNLGYIPVGTTAGTSFSDTDVVLDQDYSYRVVALGGAGGVEANSCYSNLSNCAVNNLDPIFDDGFESGDTSAWTTEEPLPPF